MVALIIGSQISDCRVSMYLLAQCMRYTTSRGSYPPRYRISIFRPVLRANLAVPTASSHLFRTKLSSRSILSSPVRSHGEQLELSRSRRILRVSPLWSLLRLSRAGERYLPWPFGHFPRRLPPRDSPRT